MPLAGVVFNRVQSLGGTIDRSRAQDAAARLEEEPAGPTTAGLLRLHADLAATAALHRAHIGRFTMGHPGIPVVEVPAAATDIHDLDGLRDVALALSPPPAPSRSAR